jgi:asparagine synthase (glutamine-hydrolysing)
MSGIAGIFHRNGNRVSNTDIQQMLDAIAHRGRDASQVWTGANAGLGNCLLWTTPESLHEQLPRVSKSGSYVLATDARIDNRDDLIRELGIRGNPERLTDSELILAAWSRWGEDCAVHLIGDFSFAIWDAREQRLFCARDSSGMRCFYYYESPETFAFASEIKALTALPGVPRNLNELRVGDYLINLYEDRASTFYKGIYRLPAASILTVRREGMSKRTYWELDQTREIRLGDDREYAEAFREKFMEAVKCRVRSAFPIGSAVSGGLDSSAIACAARDLLVDRDSQATLHTFSIIFPGLPELDLRVIDERAYIEKVIRSGNFTPHYVRGDQLNPLQDSARVHHHLDEANCAPNLYLHWGMYSAAHENGVRVFLDGLDGDTTVSHGFEYLEELARGFRWKQLHKEASLIAGNLFGGRSRARRVIWNYCARDMAPIWMVRGWRLLHGRFKEVRANGTLAHPEFTRRMALRKRAQTLTKSPRPRNARESHAQVLNLSLYAHMLEMADKSASAFGIEARYPFFDRRLIEFCLALPASQKLGNGWNRAVFRRAMDGILPAEIQWRSNKGNLSPNFYRRLIDDNGGTLNGIASESGNIFSQYVDTSAMRQVLEQYRADPMGVGGQHSIRLFMAANLALWLDQTGMKPATRIDSNLGQKALASSISC